MKIFPSHFTRRARQDGFVVFVFIALLAIMLVFFTVNQSVLIRTRQETKLLEHRQIERLNASQTNTVTAVVSPANPEPK